MPNRHFPVAEEFPDGPRWGLGLWAKVWLLIFAKYCVSLRAAGKVSVFYKHC